MLRFFNISVWNIKRDFLLAEPKACLQVIRWNVFWVFCFFVLVYMLKKLFDDSVFDFKHLILLRKVKPSHIITSYLEKNVTLITSNGMWNPFSSQILFISLKFQKNTEAVAQACSVKKMLKKIPKACSFIKKEPLAQVFSCEFWEISKNTFFTEHVWTTAS